MTILICMDVVELLKICKSFLQYVQNMYSDNCNLQFAFALHVLEIRIKSWQTLLGNILDRAPLGKLYSLAVDGSTCTQANAGFFISL